MPHSFMLPNGAISIGMMPLLMPTMPYSSVSAPPDGAGMQL